jgi:arylsulfatase A-like enzyme
VTQKPNIVLIAVDTLRADHLGCYGYSHPTSPRVDALAERGVVGERLFCPAIPTQPSFTTLYTGQHPITHNIVAHGGKAVLDRAAPFLPELLLHGGYTTCAVDNLWRARPWFGRGYEYYIDPSVKRGLLLAVTAEEINKRATEWVLANRESPFFLFLHYWDPHYPLTPPASYDGMFYEGNAYDPANRSLEPWWQHPLGSVARETWLRRSEGLITDADYVRALYDQEIRYFDDALEQLQDSLEKSGVADNTLVVLLGDHGTSLTEQNIYFEHHGLYDCTTRVPLIMSWPERLPAGQRLDPMLHMSDVAPTLLEAAGFAIPGEMEGRSAWKLFTGESKQPLHEQVISAECTWQANWSLRTEDYKLIVARDPGLRGGPPRELYDLKADPGETENIAAVDTTRADAMEAELEHWIAGRLRQTGRTEDPLREQGISLRHLAAQ